MICSAIRTKLTSRPIGKTCLSRRFRSRSGRGSCLSETSAIRQSTPTRWPPPRGHHHAPTSGGKILGRGGGEAPTPPRAGWRRQSKDRPLEPVFGADGQQKCAAQQLVTQTTLEVEKIIAEN